MTMQEDQPVIGNYAIITDGKIVNTVIWDGNTDTWSPDNGAQAVAIPDGVAVDIGWTYADGAFTGPPPPPVIPPTAEEILAANTATRNTLLAAANLATPPLQDAVDLGEATNAETALLKAWKQFRVAVNRIDLTLTNPSWPSSPAPGYGALLADASTS
ncbi:tail fiber assembly protein [Luteibacter sp.]|uniref:tail fiber assembly protein n=1 Tax=Luteibacter sp. TaxID=1886636 RepID=UPI0025BDF3B6|nr:tail fiber assembly protein [Luteibacter sp.]